MNQVDENYDRFMLYRLDLNQGLKNKMKGILIT